MRGRLRRPGRFWREEPNCHAALHSGRTKRQSARAFLIGLRVTSGWRILGKTQSHRFIKRRFLLLTITVCLCASAHAQHTVKLAGRVIDAADSTGLPGANVIIKGTTLGASTDLDGNYMIIGVPVGIYDVTARFVGFEEDTETAVEINPGYTRTIDFALSDDVVVYDYKNYCLYIYGYPYLWRDLYAPIVIRRVDYCSISLENLPVDR